MAAVMTEPKLNSFFLWGHATSGHSARSLSQHSSRIAAISKDAKTIASRPRSLSHSSSSPQLGSMAAVTASPLPPNLLRTEASSLNTLPDPRTPSPASTISRSDSTASHHPDLSDEIATLSSKLVRAINHQTNLDDELQAARHELDAARKQIATLQAAAQAHDELLRSGQLRRKVEVDKELADNRKELAEERERRKRMELEVNDLTASVFTEANNMVVAARQEKEAADKRNEQLKNQLNDTETLLQSQQEQLQDLKAVVEKLSFDRDEDESNARASTAPSTPGMGPQDRMNRILEPSNVTPNSTGADDLPPDQPLKFLHLVHPVLRHDLYAYRDFADLLKMARTNSSAPPSRVSSGSFGSINVMNLASGSSHSSQSNSPATPGFPPGSGSNSPRESWSSVPQLKDTKVYKRALAEDIEPTLRLEAAPGLSWLARRTVLNSMTAGTFSIEPMPQAPNKFRGPVNPCSLCGENRKADLYSRRHRFRTSETDEAQRYPLCEYCLGRVRSSCDYISFLRMVRDGHWRAETDDEIKGAWEESVRLRERMFWQRIGGGVIPTFGQRDSPRSPTIPRRNSAGRGNEESVRKADDTAHEDPFGSGAGERRTSIGQTTRSQAETVGAGPSRPCATGDGTLDVSGGPSSELRNETRDSLGSKSSGSETVLPSDGIRDEGDVALGTDYGAHQKEEKGLSLTIPGSFE